MDPAISHEFARLEAVHADMEGSGAQGLDSVLNAHKDVPRPSSFPPQNFRGNKAEIDATRSEGKVTVRMDAGSEQSRREKREEADRQMLQVSRLHFTHAD